MRCPETQKNDLFERGSFLLAIDRLTLTKPFPLDERRKPMRPVRRK